MKMLDYKYKRGDIVFVQLETDTFGSEQGNSRPALIIQNDVGNKHSPTVIVSFLTSSSKSKLPTHVAIGANAESGLKLPSTVLLEQIRTVDKSRITKKIGQISLSEVESINHALSVSVGLM